MRKYFIIAILFILYVRTSSVQSQIVLDQADLPMIGDLQVTTIVDSVMADTLSPGISGANVIWNFSSLNFCCIDNDYKHWVNPDLTNNAAFFPESDIALKSQCYFYHDWSTHIVTEICDNRDYYREDTAGLKYYGSDFPYSHKINYFRNVFPLLPYGQTKTNNCRIVIQQSPGSVLVSNITDTMNADGWGTIITPLGSYNAIRIYTKETVYDSLYLNGIGSLLNYMPNNYYYKWYTKGLGFPVLQISKGIMETSPDYQIARVAKYKGFEESVSEFSQQDGLESSVYPNPSTNEVIISLKTSQEVFTSTLHIFNTQGNEVFSKECKSSKELFVTKNEINKGLFFYLIIFSDGTFSKGKFVIL